jgi:predicted metal-dependent phosphotriesterase family hydrolase
MTTRFSEWMRAIDTKEEMGFEKEFVQLANTGNAAGIVEFFGLKKQFTEDEQKALHDPQDWLK